MRSFRLTAAVRVALAGSVLAATSPLVLAQSGGPSARALEEIVVTARKREERLKDVPIAVTAISDERISELNLKNVEDVARFTPGFSYTAAFGRRNGERPVIRGQSNILGEPNASFFVDGVYISGPSVSTEIASLERVEVIKGPQAALYGRATFAGAINYVTRRPTNLLEGEVRATGAEHGEYELAAWASGPLVDDRLLFFVAARHWEYGGEWTNQLTGRKVGAEETNSLSGKLLWNITDNLEAIGLLSYSEDDDNHIALTFQGRDFNNCLPRGPSNPRSRGYYCGEAVDTADLPVELRTDLFPKGGGLERDRIRGSLTLNWLLSDWTLTSVTAYSDVSEETETDVSYAGYDAFAALFNPGAFWRLEGEGTKDFSQEVRLRSPEDRPLRVTAGVYYWDSEFETTRNLKVLPSGDIVPNSGGLTQRDVTNEAVFAGLEWDISDRWTLTLEGRYGKDKVKQRSLDIPSGGTDYEVVATQQGDFSNFLPRATLTWKLNPEVTLYANYAEGAKPGTFNSGAVLSVPGVPEAVDEEQSRNYEVGAKTLLLDGRASLNVALYYVDLFDQQLTQTAFVETPTGSVANSYIENVGKTVSKGFELELNLQLTESWDLQLGYSYNDSEIKEYLNQDQADLYSDQPSSAFAPPNCGGAGQPTCAELAAQDLATFGDVSGKRPPRAPENQAFLATRVQFPLGDRLSWFVAGDVTYEGSKFAQVHNLIETGDRTYLGARVGLTGERWSVTLWGKNLTDDTTTTDILRYIDLKGVETFPQYIALGRYIPRGFALTLPRGRQVGLTASLRF
jgi:iron complex outermembrane receptor protein